MTERLEFYLTGCQLGITASSILLGVLAEPAVTVLLEPAVTLAGLPSGSVHVISITLGLDHPISRTIDLSQEARQEIAPVERDGAVVGLVTVTDMFEAIAGQLEDPFDGGAGIRSSGSGVRDRSGPRRPRAGDVSGNRGSRSRRRHRLPSWPGSVGPGR